jgi:microcystin-dependent protein
MSSQSSKVNKIYGSVIVRRDPNVPLEVSTKQYVDNKHQAGDIKFSVRSTDHVGWLVCDGRSLSRSDYAALFAVIGTSFGSASSTTFYIPNTAGKVLGSIGPTHTLGSVMGSETHTLTTPQLPSHTHGVTDPGHTHTVSNTVRFTGSGTPGGIDNSGGEIDNNNLFNTTTSSSTTGVSITATGDGEPFNIMQPTLFIGNVFIYSGQI